MNAKEKFIQELNKAGYREATILEVVDLASQFAKDMQIEKQDKNDYVQDVKLIEKNIIDFIRRYSLLAIKISLNIEKDNGINLITKR